MYILKLLSQLGNELRSVFATLNEYAKITPSTQNAQSSQVVQTACGWSALSTQGADSDFSTL